MADRSRLRLDQRGRRAAACSERRAVGDQPGRGRRDAGGAAPAAHASPGVGDGGARRHRRRPATTRLRRQRDLTADRRRARRREPDAPPGRWHGSILLFDQSVTTQTLGLGAPTTRATIRPTSGGSRSSPATQSFERETRRRQPQPLDEPVPRADQQRHHDRLARAAARADLSVGDLRPHLRDRGGYKTTVDDRPADRSLPTDKAAYDSRAAAGRGRDRRAVADASRCGAAARARCRGARLGWPPSTATRSIGYTSPINDGLHQLRAKTSRAVRDLDDQLRGEMNVQNALTLSFSGELQILRRLNVSLRTCSSIQWLYRPATRRSASPLTRA